MKLIIICYNIAIHEEVMEILKKEGLNSYTRFEKVQGVGNLSGPHLDSHIWPAVNSVLAVAAKDKKKDELIKRIKELRKKLGKEGIKAFVLPLEEIT